MRLLIILSYLLYFQNCNAQFTIRKIDSIINEIEKQDLKMTRLSDTNAVYGYDTLRRTPFISYNNELYYTGNRLHKVIEHTSICIDTCDCLSWSCNSYIDWKPEYFTMYYFYNDSLICVFNKELEEYPAVFEYLYFKGQDLEYMQAHGAQKTERYRQIRSYVWHARKIVDTFHKLIADNKLNK